MGEETSTYIDDTGDSPPDKPSMGGLRIAVIRRRIRKNPTEKKEEPNMVKKTRKWARHVHLKEGSLKGWCEKCPATKRHKALRAVVRKNGYAVAIRRLNFLRNVASRRNNRMLRTIAGRDIRWAQRTLSKKKGAK
jgi:hypothetical protein